MDASSVNPSDGRLEMSSNGGAVPEPIETEHDSSYSYSNSYSYSDVEEPEADAAPGGTATTSPGFSFSAAIAVATANEREKRRRAVLARALVDVVYRAYGYGSDCHCPCPGGRLPLHKEEPSRDAGHGFPCETERGDPGEGTTAVQDQLLPPPESTAAVSVSVSVPVSLAKDDTGEGKSGRGEGPTAPPRPGSDLVRDILARAEGSSPLPPGFRARGNGTDAAEVCHNGGGAAAAESSGPPLLLSWEWRTEGSPGAPGFCSTCVLKVSDPGGGFEVELVPPSPTQRPTVSGKDQEPSNTPPGSVPKTSSGKAPVARLGVSGFWWKLEGSTETPSRGENPGEGESKSKRRSFLPDGFGDVRSVWMIDRVSLSRAMASEEESVPVDEVLLEGRDVVLEGVLLPGAESLVAGCGGKGKDNDETKGETKNETETTSRRRPTLALRPRSLLSLSMAAAPRSGGREEMAAVGLALRACVAYLDTLLSTPDLRLARTRVASSEERVASGSAALGDALRHCLEHHCGSGGPGQGATASASTSIKKLSGVDYLASSVGTLAVGVRSSTPAGAAVGFLGLLTVDGVKAAARRGREFRTNKGPSGNADADADDPPPSGAGKGGGSADPVDQKEGYRFGDFSRGVFGSARNGIQAALRRGKEVRMSNRTGCSLTQQEQQQQQQQQQQQSFGKGKDAVANPPDRAGSDRSENENYKFGDLTRGIRNSGNQNDARNYAVENRGRFAGIAGSSAFGAAGFVLAGPVGALAGSVLGSRVGQKATELHDQELREEQDVLAGSVVGFPPARNATEMHGEELPQEQQQQQQQQQQQ